MEALFDKGDLRYLGNNVTIYPLAKITKPQVVSIGSHAIIDDFVFIGGGEETSIGEYVHVASFCCLSGGGRLIMEDFSGLSSAVQVYTGSEDFSGEGMTNPTIPPEFRSVIRSFVHIKKHVIIGSNTVILPGVTIGEGAAVGSNSLVTQDVTEWTVVAGNPANFIKERRKDVILEYEKRLREKYS